MSASNEFSPAGWEWWQAALADPSKIGTDLPVHDGEPFTGFFRSKDGEPIAFWFDGEALQCAISGTQVVENRAWDMWTFCCRKPVSYEAYQAKVNDGAWPNEVLVEINGEIESSAAKKRKPREKKAPEGVGLPGTAKKADKLADAPATVEDDANPRAVIGSNSGDTNAIDADFENVKEEIEKWKLALDKILKAGDPSTKDEADKVSDIADKLGELSRKAESMRDARKRPFLEAGREVDGMFKPIIGLAEDQKRRGKMSCKAILKKLQDEADQKRRDEEDRRRKEVEDSFDETPPAKPVEAEKVHVGNRRSSGIVKRKVAVIDDLLAVVTFFVVKDDPRNVDMDFADLAKKKALKVMTAMGANSVPGAHIEEIEDVR